MKLLFCTECQDVVKLWQNPEPRRCACGKSWGRYINKLDAEFGGSAYLLGFNNTQMGHSWNLRDQVPASRGRDFNAFFIPEGVTSAIRKE